MHRALLQYFGFMESHDGFGDLNAWHDCFGDLIAWHDPFGIIRSKNDLFGLFSSQLEVVFMAAKNRKQHSFIMLYLPTLVRMILVGRW